MSLVGIFLKYGYDPVIIFGEINSLGIDIHKYYYYLYSTWINIHLKTFYYLHITS